MGDARRKFSFRRTEAAAYFFFLGAALAAALGAALEALAGAALAAGFLVVAI